MKTTLRIAALLALAASTSSCVHRQILAFQDHPTQPVTSLEALETRYYLFWGTAEHQFFMCQDKGTQLSCERTCGGKNDIVCPEAAGTGAGVTSNVR